MKAYKTDFDSYKDQKVTAFHLENDNGVRITVLDQGGIIAEISVPTENGQHKNMLLQYPHTADYYANPFYVNMMIGTAAGRIKNGQFKVSGKTIQVTPNEGHNTLHGGPNGFHSVNWNGELKSSDSYTRIILKHHFNSNPGDFPAISVTVTYTLKNDNTFRVQFTGESDETTIFNPTYHTYFNVGDEPTIKNQILQLNSHRHMDVDTEKIPTGKLLDNINTPFDFTTPQKLGTAIDKMQDTTEKGFDDIFEVEPSLTDQTIAKLSDTISNRSVTLHSSRNGLVVFTANSFTPDMNLTIGHGAPYMGIALEAQNLSDATRFENFGDITLQPGVPKSYEIMYQLTF
ncbi:aldose epimerase family protein [Secundilactobacillus hailunensis]|uniref:Aldose epimerase family protein n=1 Tax=Secundilactobacillus hailunensis TaxID=2559923 RepID=A0ABW1T749_9LACO|nr:aldose epimerase family protein [Secundilactobacillus hailunensis]